MNIEINNFSLKYASKYGQKAKLLKKPIQLKLKNQFISQQDNLSYDVNSNNSENTSIGKSNKAIAINIGEKLYFTGIKKIEKKVKKNVLNNIYNKENNENNKFSNSKKKQYFNNIYSKIQTFKDKKDKKIKKLQKEQLIKEMNECSFNPKLNKSNIKSKFLKSDNKRYVKKGINDKLMNDFTFKPKINNSIKYKVDSNFFERNEKFSINKKKNLENSTKIKFNNIYKNKTNKKNEELLKDKHRSNIFDDLYNYHTIYSNKLNKKILDNSNNIKNISQCEKISNNSKNLIKNKIFKNFQILFNKLAINSYIDINKIKINFYNEKVKDIINFIKKYNKKGDKLNENDFINILIDNKYIENKKIPEKNWIFSNLISSSYISINNSKKSLKASSSLKKSFLLSSDVKGSSLKRKKDVVSRLYKIKNPLN